MRFVRAQLTSIPGATLTGADPRFVTWKRMIAERLSGGTTNAIRVLNPLASIVPVGSQ